MPRRFETPLQASDTPEVSAHDSGRWSRREIWETVRPVGFHPAALREVARLGLLGSSDMQACLGCGAEVPEAGRFCPTCGSVLTGSGSIDPRSPSAALSTGGEPRSSLAAST